MLTIIWTKYTCFFFSNSVNNLSPFGLITFLLLNKRSFKVSAFLPVWSLLEAVQTSTLLFRAYLRLVQERDEKVILTFSSLYVALKSDILSLGYIIRTSLSSLDLRHPVGIATNWTMSPRKAFSLVVNVFIKKMKSFWTLKLGQASFWSQRMQKEFFPLYRESKTKHTGNVY